MGTQPKTPKGSKSRKSRSDVKESRELQGSPKKHQNNGRDIIATPQMQVSIERKFIFCLEGYSRKIFTGGVGAVLRTRAGFVIFMINWRTKAAAPK